MQFNALQHTKQTKDEALELLAEQPSKYRNLKQTFAPSFAPAEACHVAVCNERTRVECDPSEHSAIPPFFWYMVQMRSVESVG